MNAMGTWARSAAVMPAAGKPIRRLARSMNRADAGLDAGKLAGVEFARARAAGLVEPVSGSTAWRLPDKGREALARLSTGGRRSRSNLRVTVARAAIRMRVRSHG
jgi:hypothetical protein